MNLVQLQDKLLSAARRHPPGEQVPYAFEKRVMARLADVPRLDVWAVWTRAFWRGAVACAAVTLLLGAWTSLPPGEEDSAQSFSQDLEQTILASAASADDVDGNWW